MSDSRKTKAQLLAELAEVRQEVDRLKAIEAEYLEQKQTLKQPNGMGQSPEILRTIIDSTPDWIFIKDREHRYRLVNRAYAATMGLVPEEFIGKDDLEIGFPEEIVKGDDAKGIRGFWTDDRAVMESGEPKFIEVEPAVIDGEPAYLRTRKIPLRDAAGEVWGVLGFVQIITEQKRTEELLTKRASELETVAEVSTVAATVLEVDKLLQEVTDLTKERFGLYHAHIYLLDEAGESLNLAAGAGQVGRQMVAEGWSIPLEREQSLVVEAARKGRGVIVNDVQAAPGFMPNPLLPETRAEMAVPMMVGERVVGVLDVQADVIDRFTAEDVQIETTLAAQIAVALENASQHEQTRTALAEVQQSQALMRSIIDATPDWIFIKDQEHRYRLANRGYATDLHMEPEDFIGKNDLELGFPEELVKGDPEKGIRGFWTDDRLVMDSGETQVYPNDPATIDRKIHTFHTIKTPLRDADGQVWGVLAFARDITDRQGVEEALRESQAQLSEALDIARLGYWEFDVESQIFTFNDQFYEMLRTTAEKEGGYQMPAAVYAQKYVHPEDGPNVGRNIQQALETTDPDFSFEEVSRVVCADGEVRHMLVKFRIEKDEHGRTVKLIGANQDVTEQQQIEAERERLLVEVEAAYRQYVRQEWDQFLGEHHQGQWRIEHHQGGLPESLSGNGKSGAALEFPVSLRGQAIGTVSLEDLTPDRKWSTEEKALVETVSQQLALTVENLRLFEDTQQQATREQLARQITDKMRSAPDAESIIQVGVQELAKVFQSSHLVVELDMDNNDGESVAMDE